MARISDGFHGFTLRRGILSVVHLEERPGRLDANFLALLSVKMRDPFVIARFYADAVVEVLKSEIVPSSRATQEDMVGRRCLWFLKTQVEIKNVIVTSLAREGIERLSLNENRFLDAFLRRMIVNVFPRKIEGPVVEYAFDKGRRSEAEMDVEIRMVSGTQVIQEHFARELPSYGIAVYDFLCPSDVCSTFDFRTFRMRPVRR